MRPQRAMPRAIVILAACALGTAACASPTEPEVLTLFVGPERVECMAVGPSSCLEVRESPDEPWRNFFAVIEDFEYEPGFFYELLVERHEIENPPADASRFRYVLLEIVSKVPA